MAGTGILDDDLQKRVDSAKILVVGAGGIGCELLKNLVLTGFKDIEVIDLDTIDVSNLNRQFLFHKQHVGKSKAKVARESALQFNPDAQIVAIHDSIINPKYGVSYFKQFNVVLNALDNRAARNHVNRLCLAAEVPLIESGTAGYDGQVELIVKGRTKCYECNPKAPQKTFPGCTIRNTPSEPIHCIVWSKHLFNQLFGEEDADQDVSPDTADPEAAGEAGAEALKAKSTNAVEDQRVSTRSWAQACHYDPEKLFTKLFQDDIKYLLSMDNLWKSRRPPQPLEWGSLPDAVQGSSTQAPEQLLKDQRCWSISECAKVFAESVNKLQQQFEALKPGDHLVWDKDDRYAMDFVAACANIRSYIFGISQKSRFDVKSMAGNIIPAIATTNAIVAGVVVLHTLNVLREQLERCQSVYLRLRPNPRGLIIVPERQLEPPNPKCYVCSHKPTVALSVDISKLTVKELEEAVLKKALNMVAPDARLDDGSGSIIISSEEGETEHNNDKTLQEVGIKDQTVMMVDDFLQNYELAIIITHKEEFPDGLSFEIVAGEDVKPKEEETVNNGYKLIKGWRRNVRDAYFKGLKKKKKSGQVADTERPFIYAQQLSFQQTAGATADTESSMEHQDKDLNQSGDQFDFEPTQTRSTKASASAVISPRYDLNTSKRRKRSIESAFIEFINAPTPSSVGQTTPEPNANRSFLESRFPFINRLSTYEKLHFQTVGLMLIKFARLSQTTQQNTVPFQYSANASNMYPNSSANQCYSNSTPDSQSAQSSPETVTNAQNN